MAELFIRVELKGGAGGEIYAELREYMEDLDWERQVDDVDLPTAMYYGDSDEEPAALGKALHADIVEQIWSDAVVLIMETSDWAIITS